MWEAHRKRCFYDHTALMFGNMQVDHIIPQALFTGHEDSLRSKYNLSPDFDFESLDNYAPACQFCNVSRKRAEELENAIPMWLAEVASLKSKIISGAQKIKNKLTLDLPDQYKEFFVSSPDFMLSGISLERIRKIDIPLIKELTFRPDLFPLKMTSPEDSNIKIPVHSLSQFEHYFKIGYYGASTPEIALDTLFQSCLFILDKFKDAIFLEIHLDFREFYRSLPASILHVIGPESDFQFRDCNTIGECIDKNKNIDIEIDGKSLILTIHHDEFKQKEIFRFDEIIQADFSGNGNHESILLIFYRSPGSFHCSFPLYIAFQKEKLIVLAK